MLDDRRKFARSDTLHVVEVNSYTRLMGLIRDFSSQGFSFEMDNTDFVQKEKVEFKLIHPQSKLGITFFGDVVWENRNAHTLMAGVKLRSMDEAIKKKFIEILSAIRDVPAEWFVSAKNSGLSGIKREEEKAEEHAASSSSGTDNSSLGRIYILGFSVMLLILSGLIMVKVTGLPDIIMYFQNAPKQTLPIDYLPVSESGSIKEARNKADIIASGEEVSKQIYREIQLIVNKADLQLKADNNFKDIFNLSQTAAVDEVESLFEINKFVTAGSIEYRKPVEITNRYSSLTEKAYCFLDARHIVRETKVSFVWFYEGKEESRIALTLKKGYRWRTYSTKRLEGMKGAWKVELHSETGDVLAASNFVVE